MVFTALTFYHPHYYIATTSSGTHILKSLYKCANVLLDWPQHSFFKILQIIP